MSFAPYDACLWVPFLCSPVRNAPRCGLLWQKILIQWLSAAVIPSSSILKVTSLMLDSNTCIGITTFVPLCYKQIRGCLSPLSPLIYIVICMWQNVNMQLHHVRSFLHVNVFDSYLQWLLYQIANTCHSINEGRSNKLCSNLYVTQWDKIHNSNTCVWTRYKYSDSKWDRVVRRFISPSTVKT